MHYGKALAYEYPPVDIDQLSHAAFHKQRKANNINFRKLFRRAGIKRISSNMNAFTSSILREYMTSVLSKSMCIMNHDRSRTLRLIHILYALK